MDYLDPTSTPGTGTVAGKNAFEDCGAGKQGTTVNAAALNPFLFEIMNVIEGAGLDPDSSNLSQLYEGIRIISGARLKRIVDIETYDGPATSLLIDGIYARYTSDGDETHLSSEADGLFKVVDIKGRLWTLELTPSDISGIAHLKCESAPLFFAVWGQSNFISSNNDGTGNYRMVNPNVYIWDSQLGTTGEMKVSKQGEAPYNIPPTPYPSPLSVYHHFGNILNVITGRDIAAVQRAKGSEGIEEFIGLDDGDGDGDNHFAWLNNEISQAISLSPILSDKKYVDGVIGHQGEQNNATSIATYSNHWDTLISLFSGSDWFSSGVPFLMGEMLRNSNTDAMNAFHSSHITNKYPFVSTVSSIGLSGDSGGIHFDGLSVEEYGRRYALKYVRMVGSSMPLCLNGNYANAKNLGFTFPSSKILQDILLPTTQGGLRSDATPYGPLEGKTGFRHLVRAALEPGDVIPIGMAGGFFSVSGGIDPATSEISRYFLPENAPSGHVVIVKTSALGGVIIDANGGIIDDQPQISIPLPRDVQKFVSIGNNTWTTGEGDVHDTNKGVFLIDDDDFVVIKPSISSGFFTIFSNPNAGNPSFGGRTIMEYEVGSSPFLNELFDRSQIKTVVSSTPNGTTGQDGDLTIFADGGKIYLENRLGAQIQVKINFI